MYHEPHQSDRLSTDGSAALNAWGPSLAARTGNTLVITLLVVVMVIGLVSVASDQLAANQALKTMDRDHQRAQLTAESFISLIEDKLYYLAATDTALLKKDLKDLDDEMEMWFSLKGLDSGKTTDALGTVVDGTAQNAIYLDGCALRWRVEPIKIMTQTRTEGNDPNVEFFVNSERDPDLEFERREEAGSMLIANDAQHFHFRIAVEAYVLKQPGDLTSVPWSQSGKHTATAQAQRVIQFEDVNALRYLFNYVAEGPTGDLEFSPTSQVNITGGGFRSNQRIFFTKGASGFVVGAAATGAIPIEAADGIFRINKALMHQANLQDAKLVPVSASAPNDTGGSIILNGVSFVETGDSRTSIASHHSAVRDGSPGREIQEELRPYQAWNRGFLMSHTTFGAGTPVYNYGTAGAPVWSTLAKNHPYFPAISGTPVANASAAGQPMFNFPDPIDNTKVFKDMWPFPPGTYGNYGFLLLTEANLIHPDTGLPPLPVPMPPKTNPATPRTQIPAITTTTYFQTAIGAGSRDRTGLVIRERGRWDGPAGLNEKPNPKLSTETGAVIPPLDLRDYNDWMRANYVVYLGRAENVDVRTDYQTPSGWWQTVDITDEFFAFSLPATGPAPTTVRELMLHEDVVRNSRDRQWYQDQGHQNTNANVLTLNLDRVLAFIQTRPPVGSDLDVSHPGKNYSELFNGYIYLERTPRPFTDTPPPTLTPYANPLAPTGYYHPDNVSLSLTLNGGTLPLSQKMLLPIVGNDLGLLPLAQHGAVGTWAVYPHQRGVRIDKATNGARYEISIFTPNTCYLWGDFNTFHGDNAQSCAVYADSIIALSNAWEDQNAVLATLPVATSTTYRAAFITHNVPTDNDNAVDGGSGGAENLMRLLENWTGQELNVVGAFVVPGRMRQTRVAINKGTNKYHEDPIYSFTYDGDLLTSDGLPKGAPKSTYARRVLSTVQGSSR